MIEKCNFITIYKKHEKLLLGWEQILDREKIPYNKTDNFNAKIIVFDKDYPRETAEFVSNGGVAIIERPEKIEEVLLKKEGEAIISKLQFPELGLLDIDAPSIMNIYNEEGNGYFEVNELRKIKNNIYTGIHPLVVKIPYGKGYYIVLSISISMLLLLHGSTLRNFLSFSPFTERVASVDKVKIERMMIYILKLAFQLANIPYIRLSYYPEDYRTMFMLRVDVDGVENGNVENLSKVCEKFRVRATFYVNKELCEGGEEDLKRISPYHDIGNHNNIHNVFNGLEENIKNIRDGEEWIFKVLGVKTDLFVAPRGIWNEALGEALEKLSYKSSSDFGYHFDGFPFHPIVGGKQLKLLQVPVNPYCPGRAKLFLEEHRLGELKSTDVVGHYKNIINEKEKLEEPIMIYGHPHGLGYYCEELEEVFSYMEEKNIPNISIKEFTNWWIKRENTNIQIHFDNSQDVYYVETSNPDIKIRLDKHFTVNVI